MKNLFIIIILSTSTICYSQMVNAQLSSRQLTQVNNLIKNAVEGVKAQIRDSSASLRLSDAAILTSAKAYTDGQAFVRNDALVAMFNGYLKTNDLPLQLTTMGYSKDKLFIYDATKFIVTVTSSETIDTVRIKLK